MRRSRTSKLWLRRLLGAALLPVLAIEIGAVTALLTLGPPTFELLAFGLGFALWIIVFHSLPRPFRAYVLAHELSHALWGFATGSSVSDLRVSHRGGSVRLSHAGLFSTLAPYLLPLYTLLLLAAYGVTALFFDPAPWHILWMAALGASWGFHVSFTLAITLDTPQPDLRAYGFFFSGVLITVVNLAVLFTALTLLGSASWTDAAEAILRAGRLLPSGVRWIAERLG